MLAYAQLTIAINNKMKLTLILIFCFVNAAFGSVEVLLPIDEDIIKAMPENIWDLYAGDESEFERDGINDQDALIRDPSQTTMEFTAELILKDGYTVEEHKVITPDGYILTVYRVPGGPVDPPRPGKLVVFVQHGLLSSSADWMIIGKERSLVYMLSDAGYDVWLGNHRGNTHSRAHQYLSPNKREFWDYSWHEIGQIDLPAMINYALDRTGKTKLHYVGHSQGTTAFFVMGSLRPDMMPKITTMHALAPVAFMGHLKSPFVRAVAPFSTAVDTISSMLGIHEFFPSNKMMKKGGYFLCRDESIFQELCANSLFLIGGFNSEQLNRTLLPAIMQYTPAGASRHQLVHYGQEVNSKKFRMFDFGFFGNRARYGSSSPPDYQLSNVNAPVALHYGDNDWLAAVRVSSLLSPHALS